MEGGEARIVAYTKVFAIRARLDKRVRYITDGEKTSLASSITYISNPEKTEQFFFTSVLNCSSVDTALSEMMETKQQFGKMGGVLGYHFIQSFQPGEVTPEQAHAVGLEFAKRLFGKRYEVVISTHLNKHHLHNHLVVNSVSCIDGQKYHSSPESYYNDVRGTSDALCRENDLSVIAPQGKGKHYAEWKAEQGGKPTVRGVIRADIDTIIGQAYTYDSFLMLLRRNGYEVRRSPNRKYTTVKPPGAKRAIRLDSLGEGYTEAEILLRLSRQRHGGMTPPTVTHAVKRYRIKGKLATVQKKKITGFHALYLRYLYLLRGGRRKKLPPKLPFSVKREVIHLERYDWMKMTADAARNLFSWNSKCAATPFEISRMPAPAIQALFTSFFIANGDYAVSVRENEDGKKEFVMDDSAGREREKIRQQFDQMLADIGAEMD